MLKINRIYNGNRDTPNKTFEIVDLNSNEIFNISYADSGDIYWWTHSNNEMISFEIEQFDLILLSSFEELFNNLRTNKLFTFNYELFQKEKKLSKLFSDDINYIKTLIYDKNKKTIKYKSDALANLNKETDCHYFEILEKDNSYNLKFFNKNKKENLVTILMNTNRSKYGVLINLFIHLYRDLDYYYDYYDNYQFTVDDYLYPEKSKVMKLYK